MHNSGTEESAAKTCHGTAVGQGQQNRLHCAAWASERDMEQQGLHNTRHCSPWTKQEHVTLAAWATEHVHCAAWAKEHVHCVEWATCPLCIMGYRTCALCSTREHVHCA
jgi:hypothetical protein